MKINVNNAVVEITETTLKQLLKAVEEAKQEIKFEDSPQMSVVSSIGVSVFDDEDIEKETKCVSDGQWLKERSQRGIIRVSSYYSGIDFDIELETSPCTQESIGYEWLKG